MKESKQTAFNISSATIPDTQGVIVPGDSDIMMSPQTSIIPENLRKWTRQEDIAALDKAAQAAEASVADAQAEHAKLDAITKQHEELQKQRLLKEIEEMFLKKKKSK